MAETMTAGDMMPAMIDRSTEIAAGQAAGQNEEQRTCPVCQGAGQIAASMGREEMLTAINEGMPSPESPEQGEAQMNDIRNYAENRPLQLRDQPMDTGEVARLGGRAVERMRNRGGAY